MGRTFNAGTPSSNVIDVSVGAVIDVSVCAVTDVSICAVTDVSVDDFIYVSIESKNNDWTASVLLKNAIAVLKQHADFPQISFQVFLTFDGNFI